MEKVMTSVKTQHPGKALESLGLEEEAMEALQHQGFVAEEFRDRAGRRWGPYYKLRWRQDGRQRVRYLGNDTRRVHEIRVALQHWQQVTRLTREVEELFRQSRKALKSLKDALSPQVSAAGKRWHGYQTRRPCKSSSEANGS